MKQLCQIRSIVLLDLNCLLLLINLNLKTTKDGEKGEEGAGTDGL